MILFFVQLYCGSIVGWTRLRFYCWLNSAGVLLLVELGCSSVVGRTRLWLYYWLNLIVVLFLVELTLVLLLVEFNCGPSRPGFSLSSFSLAPIFTLLLVWMNVNDHHEWSLKLSWAVKQGIPKPCSPFPYSGYFIKLNVYYLCFVVFKSRILMLVFLFLGVSSITG